MTYPDETDTSMIPPPVDKPPPAPPLPSGIRPEPQAGGETRPWEELRSSGLLWLINAAVLHPRGFAIAVVLHEDKLVGWQLLGNGTEPWTFLDGDCYEPFAAVEAFLNSHRAQKASQTP